MEKLCRSRSYLFGTWSLEVLLKSQHVQNGVNNLSTCHTLNTGGVAGSATKRDLEINSPPSRPALRNHARPSPTGTDIAPLGPLYYYYYCRCTCYPVWGWKCLLLPLSSTEIRYDEFCTFLNSSIFHLSKYFVG